MKVDVVKPSVTGRIRGAIPDIIDFIKIWLMLTGFLLCLKFLTGCAGGGYYAVPVNGYYQPAYVPQFVQPIAPQVQPFVIPQSTFPNAQIDTARYQRFNGASTGQIKY